ncbi:MAG: hypothetical protein HFE62_01620 [Firmicutes bacterium]|nr:hypothetical protein [Bacillota bacterium]
MMNNNEFKDMQNYKMDLKYDNKERYKKERVNKDEKEPKTAIWWMIVIFCIVYGTQHLYNAMFNV